MVYVKKGYRRRSTRGTRRPMRRKYAVPVRRRGGYRRSGASGFRRKRVFSRRSPRTTVSLPYQKGLYHASLASFKNDILSDLDGGNQKDFGSIVVKNFCGHINEIIMAHRSIIQRAGIPIKTQTGFRFWRYGRIVPRGPAAVVRESVRLLRTWLSEASNTDELSKVVREATDQDFGSMCLAMLSSVGGPDWFPVRTVPVEKYKETPASFAFKYPAQFSVSAAGTVVPDNKFKAHAGTINILQTGDVIAAEAYVFEPSDGGIVPPRGCIQTYPGWSDLYMKTPGLATFAPFNVKK